MAEDLNERKKSMALIVFYALIIHSVASFACILAEPKGVF
jgi:hypothetical protein